MGSNVFLQLAAAAAAAVPDLELISVGGPHHSDGHWAETVLMDTTGSYYSVLAAKTPEAQMKLTAAQTITKALRRVIQKSSFPYQLPNYLGTVKGTLGLVTVMRQLPGAGLQAELLSCDLATNIGKAIATIHELPRELVQDLNIPAHDAAEVREHLFTEIDQAARTSRIPATLLNRWEHQLENISMWQFASCIIHGDLTDAALLHRGDSITAIDNWHDLALGDPAADLAWLIAAMPEEFQGDFLHGYRQVRTTKPDDALLDRALLMSEIALARWLMYGVRHEDAEVIADAESMLHTLAREVGDDRQLGPNAPEVTLAEPWVDTPPNGNQPAGKGPVVPDDQDDSPRSDSSRYDSVPPVFDENSDNARQ
ncbi:MAG: phosphotransferase [Bowdeniella nasicola]|nr:phosphotransferase [Bowdeniella nasicola]